MAVVLVIVFGWAVWLSVQMHGGRGSALVVWFAGLGIWVVLPHVISDAVDTADVAQRQWWSTSWYWSVEPLPLDIAALFDWEPAVDPIGGWRAIPILGLQTVTVVLVLGGLGLLVAALRASRNR